MAWYSARAGAPAAAHGRADGSDPARPTFLLIHGVGLSHRSFSRLARALVEHGTVLAPDLPGFGRAPGARRRVSVEEMAEALLPALDGSRIRPRSLVVLGHSLGAQVAVEVARLRPDLVRGVVLIGPVVDTRAPSAVGQARRLLLDMVLEPPLTGAMVGRDYIRGGLLSFAAGVRSMLRHATAERVPAVPAPFLVLRGSGDPVSPSRWNAELAHLVADGRTVEVAGAVHNAAHSHPTEVARHVVGFAASLDGD
ncbi:alpha/beta fold hydrolase [Clavibacter michiganensis]|uniref:alpha/beta fold hydrolase n=1 Tax=Clavibacter michiganensis TaxID=28447 RepID=UPI00068DBD9E|nr:alpha/beta fold hydrolase [Clavibacter michiganensis]